MNNEDNPAAPHVSPFEAIRQEGEDGSEYWSARDLSKILGYTEWRNFNTAIEKAKEACQNSGQAVSDHFVGFNKMIEVGKRAHQQIPDHMGSTELAANLFRATQTEEKIRREGIKGKDKANRTHFQVGQKVRQTIQELGGTMPEDLPTPKESIQQLQQKEQKRLKQGSQLSMFDEPADPAESDSP